MTIQPGTVKISVKPYPETGAINVPMKMDSEKAERFRQEKLGGGKKGS